MDLAGLFWFNVVLLSMTAIAIITGLVLGIMTCCKARRRDDLARSAIPWLKASASITVLSQFLWLVGAGLLVLYYGLSPSSSSSSSEETSSVMAGLAELKNVESFFRKPDYINSSNSPILSPIAVGQVQCFALLLEVVGYISFIATQVEFVFGLQALSEAASSPGGTSRYSAAAFKITSRVLCIGIFVLTIVLAIGLFVAQEIYVMANIDMSAKIMNILTLVVYIFLALAAIASLVFTILRSRDFLYGYRELRFGLISLNSITVVRHICMVVLTGLFGASHFDGIWKSQSEAAPFIRVIIAHLTYAISLGIAYGIATKNFEGLWASVIYRQYLKA